MKAKKLILYPCNEQERPIKVLGIVTEDNPVFFKFKTGTGRVYEVSKSAKYALYDTGEEFLDTSEGEYHD